MIKQLLLTLLIIGFPIVSFSQDVFINEINHLGSNKGVEIAGPEGTDLNGWQILILDNGGNVINTLPLATSIPVGNTYDLVWVEVILNMPIDNGGVVLAKPLGVVAQYVSYGGQITGGLGTIVAGMNSINIPIGPQTDPNQSLQLVGTGTQYQHFSWAIPNTTTPAAVNTGQTFGAGAAAPIELIYFRGEMQENEIQLKWATAIEENNDFFQIEYSLGGNDFEVIAEIDGKGNSEEVSNYQFTHQNLERGEHYYRLVQVDFDGTEFNSDIIYFKSENANAELQLFPNPTSEKLTLKLPFEDTQTVQIQLFDLVGKQLMSQTQTAENQITLDLSNFNKGQYILVTNIRNNVYNKLIIKE